MGEDAEKKYLASLDFKIDEATKKLETISNQLDELAKKSEKTFENMKKNLDNSFSGATSKNLNSSAINNMENLTKAQKTQLAIQETNAQKHAQKMEEIEARNQKQLTSKVKEGTSSRIAEYAKTYLTYQGFNQLKQAALDTVEAMKSVEYRMMEISRIMEEGSIVVNQYRDDLIDLAYEYGRSFDEVSSVTLNFARAGYDANDSLALTEDALLALNTAELDAAEATDGLISVMAQWGLDTGTTAEKSENLLSVIDKINKTADNFPISSEGLLQALQRTSQGFNLAGATIDETIALIVAAERASQRGGKVIGTAMANIIQQLKAEGKLNLAEELGLDFYEDEAQTTFKSITDIFAEMSERMTQLKNEGKESSTEMQSLLELFTVFRRNIGAGLLSEMEGEDSTYLQALETSMNSLGYSAQENSKYMSTATAATEQFNATLLKLQTSMWDSGGQDFFYAIINGASDLVEVLNKLIDTIGVVPTAIGAVTLAYTAMKSKISVSDVTSLTSNITELKFAINQYNDMQKENIDTTEWLNDENKKLSNSTKNYLNSLGGAKASLSGYTASMVAATAKQALLTAGTIALNAALTAGISVIATLIATGIDNLVNAEQKAIEKNEELIQKSNELAESYSNQTETLTELANEYDNAMQKYNQLKESKSDTSESETKLLEIQTKINTALEESNKSVNIISEDIDEYGNRVVEVNQKYEEQLALVKSIAYENKKNEVSELKKALDLVNENLPEFNIDFFTKDFENVQIAMSEINKNFWKDSGVYSQADFNTKELEEQVQILANWRNQLIAASTETNNYSEEIETLDGLISQATETTPELEEATRKYTDALGELYAMSGQIDNLNIFLDAISQSYNIEGPQELIEEFKGLNQEFTDGQINITEYFDKMQEKISEIDFSATGEELEAYQAIFAATTASIADGLENMMAGFNSSEMDFADYAQGIKEAADNTLDLYAKSNDLQEVNGIWQDAEGNVNEYANSLANARNELGSFGDMLTVIGDNYDYISEHADLAGNAAFKMADVSSAQYQQLANDFATQLNNMKVTNETAYNAITAKVFEAMGTSANEVANADAYITEALNGNAQALNAALNEAANQVSLSTSKVTISMGNVLSQLGNAISNFTYTINAKPYILGDIGIKKDENGLPIGISLPTFGFDITGEGGESVQNLGSALSQFGSDLSNLGQSTFKYNRINSQLRPYVSSGGSSGGYSSPVSSGGSGGSSGSGGGSSYSRDTSAEDAARAEAEAIKEYISMFEEIIDERERLEDRWVTNKKKLGLISSEDEKYILQESIKRYKQYVEEVNQLTYASEEEKTRLRKKYGEIAEDLEVEYFELLQDILDEEISAIEDKYDEDVDAYNDAVDAKIDKIKEQADAEIAALEEVEEENDRIRQREEYEANRNELVHGYQGVEYWEQRTGREAQLALAEAKKKVEDLDKNWEETVNKWNVEDQIKLIEERRDADIEATEAERDAYLKALEETKNAEIQALKDKYQYQLDYFNQTGQIIQDNATIQSEELFKIYKEKFIDPVGEELRKALNSYNEYKASASTSTSSGGSTTTYTIQYGDTLSGIAARYGTTIEKIMAANPSITDRNIIYAGRQLRIPTSHTGSKVISDGIVELQAGETVLNMDWARGLDRMLGQFARNENNTNNITNGSTINVDGDLIKVEANIEDKTDAAYFSKRLFREMESKFNIKK